MKTCEGCGLPFEWGFCDGKWVPLEPLATSVGLPRAYVDEDGELRADHRDRPEHDSGGYGEVTNLTRLAHKIKPADLGEGPGGQAGIAADPNRTWGDAQ